MSADTLHVDICVWERIEVKLAAPPGFTVLFGPSGSGKSTTLLAVAGLVRPTRGSIRLGDTTLFAEDVNVPPERRRIGLVFQSLALFPHLSALENVAYGLRGKERTEKAFEWLERLRVQHLAARLPSTFSGGEAQRVALARALAIDPRVLLLDEPFSALDEPLRLKLRDDLIQLVADRAVPVVFVTHDKAEARALAQQVVVLDHGAVVRTGSAADVLG